ncbi:hypothetical protein LX36DRAFT_662910 [Colletotrichum falcatum]|nr:hypothetical protein LX36DRAFT_662910 [Colletotrichum falcatum]
MKELILVAIYDVNTLRYQKAASWSNRGCYDSGGDGPGDCSDHACGYTLSLDTRGNSTVPHKCKYKLATDTHKPDDSGDSPGVSEAWQGATGGALLGIQLRDKTPIQAHDSYSWPDSNVVTLPYLPSGQLSVPLSTPSLGYNHPLTRRILFDDFVVCRRRNGCIRCTRKRFLRGGMLITPHSLCRFEYSQQHNDTCYDA